MGDLTEYPCHVCGKGMTTPKASLRKVGGCGALATTLARAGLADEMRILSCLLKNYEGD